MNDPETIRKALEPMWHYEEKLSFWEQWPTSYRRRRGAANEDLIFVLNDKSQTGARFKDVMFGSDGLDEITIDTYSDRATFQLRGLSSAVVNCDEDKPFGPIGAIDIDELSVRVWLVRHGLEDPREG